MAIRTKPLPVVGAEQIGGGRYRSVCVDCPDWHGPNRDTYASARDDGRMHLVTDHGAPVAS